MVKLAWALATLAISSSLSAQAPVAGPQIADASFLVGDWQAGQGKVFDAGGTAKGRSTFTLEAGGNVLLRRDHTDLFSQTGKPTGSFEQIMMIYPEGSTLHADYSDGTHVIHYVNAEIVAGRSVTFTSASRPNAPTFRLGYQLTNPTTLSVAFEMAPPGSADFHPIATGSLTKAR